MKKLILIGFLAFMSTILSKAQNPKTHACAASKIRNHSLNQKSATIPDRLFRKSEMYNVKHYGLDLEMTNLSTFITGKVVMSAVSKTSLDTIVYELFPSLSITSILLNGNSVPFRREGAAVKIAANFAPGTAFKVSTSYNGTPPDGSTNPLGGSGMTNDVSPSWSNQVTWSLSQPFSAYEWWPCKQSLKDKIDSVDVWITVPSVCKAGSNGLLKKIVPIPGGKSQYQWKHKHSICYYLVSVAVAKYIEYNFYAHPAGTTDSIFIQNYIYDNPATLPNFKSLIDETADYIKFFSEAFGPYPFKNEKYGHCMAPLGGGMEHQTMTTQGTFTRTLTAHELAHQWFGDHVTCASWADIWVNEGFATYGEYLVLERLFASQAPGEMQSNHNAVIQNPVGSVWVEDSLNGDRLFSGRLSYAKGAAILHTFRYIMNNDSLFFAALRAYQNRFADSVAYGLDVKAIFEEFSGIDYTKAFEEWYFGEGFPTYSAKWNTVGNDLHLQITHTVSAPTVTPTFTTPVEIRFKRVGKADTIIRFQISANLNSYIIPNLGNVQSIVSIDPNNFIINRNGTFFRDINLIITNLESNPESDDISIFPNPASDKFTIQINNQKQYQLRMIEPGGKEVLNQFISTTQDVNIEKEPKGVYILQLTSSDGLVKRTKLIRK